MIVEKSSGHVGELGEYWRAITGTELDKEIAKAAKSIKSTPEQIIDALLKGQVCYTGDTSPNYYYDHGLAKIRAVMDRAPKPQLVKCSCGHSVPRNQVMSASLGSACPNCYDRMSD